MFLYLLFLLCSYGLGVVVHLPSYPVASKFHFQISCASKENRNSSTWKLLLSKKKKLKFPYVYFNLRLQILVQKHAQFLLAVTALFSCVKHCASASEVIH